MTLTEERAMDDSKIESFQERLFTELNAGFSCLSLYMGTQLGLFDVLADGRAVTSSELAGQKGYNERYVREWLECMVAGEYLDYEATSGRFSLPAEHAAVLTEPDHPGSAMGMIGLVPSFASVVTNVIDGFKTGEGVPYEAYGLDMVNSQGLFNRPMFVNDYVGSWIPTMPDIEARLKNGGKVAEVGCGIGWSAIAVAKGFPNAHVDAIDPDDLSLKEAKRNAHEAGVSDRIGWFLNTVEDAPLDGGYDLVTAFECLHDMPYPVQALSRMREILTPGGAVLIADEAVEENLEDNRNFMGHLFYNFSVLHCLPQAMGFKDSAETGTVIKASTVRKYAEQAGFSSVEVLDIENPMWRFYKLNA